MKRRCDDSFGKQDLVDAYSSEDAGATAGTLAISTNTGKRRGGENYARSARDNAELRGKLEESRGLGIGQDGVELEVVNELHQRWKVQAAGAEARLHGWRAVCHVDFDGDGGPRVAGGGEWEVLGGAYMR